MAGLPNQNKCNLTALRTMLGFVKNEEKSGNRERAAVHAIGIVRA